MKRTTLCLVVFACLFLAVFAPPVLARDGHHGGHHGGRHHDGHHGGGHHGHHGGHHWSHGGHHGGHHGRHHYNDHYRGHHHRNYYPWGYTPYDEWYGSRYRPYNYGYYAPPLVEFNFDWYDPQPLPPRPLQRPQRYEESEEAPQQVVEERHVSQERLDALRTQGARDYQNKTPMPFDTFDSMSAEERRAYGEEWDRLMLVGDGKGPYFKKKRR